MNSENRICDEVTISYEYLPDWVTGGSVRNGIFSGSGITYS